MADEVKPQLVSDAPPQFRVRTVPHGDSAGIEDELEAAETDGYSLQRALGQANGDVILMFRREASAAAPEAEA